MKTPRKTGRMNLTRTAGRIPPYVAAIVLCTAVVAAAGCAGREQFYNDIAARRALSYQTWLDKRNRSSQSRDVIRGKLSLEECLGIALVNNKQIASAVCDKENARGKITESYSLALPQLGLTGSYTRLDETPSADFGGQSMVMGSADNYALSANLSQPLFRGGSIGAGIRAARLYACMADESVREAVQQVIFDVRKTFYDILLAQELLRVADEAVELSRRHLTDVQNRRRAGVASDYDVLRAKVEVSNYDAEVIRSRNRLHLLETSFYKLLGVSQESEIEFVGELRYEPVEPSLEKAAEAAFARRPELMQAELQCRLYKENLTASKAERWPKFDLFFSENYTRPDPHDSMKMSWGDSWTAGATMSFAIFDGLKTKGRVRQAKADLAKSRVRLADCEEAVLLDVRQATFNINDADSFVKSQQANVKRAAEGYELAEAGYKEGVNTELEVRDARQALLHARALHYQAVHSHSVARLQLRRAMGALGPPVDAGQAGRSEHSGAPTTADQRAPEPRDAGEYGE